MWERASSLVNTRKNAEDDRHDGRHAIEYSSRKGATSYESGFARRIILFGLSWRIKGYPVVTQGGHFRHDVTLKQSPHCVEKKNTLDTRRTCR